MPTNKYELVLDNEVIASGMDVNTALILIGALYAEYYNEEGMSITIREMDRAKANESNDCESEFINLVRDSLLTALEHCMAEECEGCPLNGGCISEDCIIHLLRTSHKVIKDLLGK